MNAVYISLPLIWVGAHVINAGIRLRSRA